MLLFLYRGLQTFVTKPLVKTKYMWDLKMLVFKSAAILVFYEMVPFN